MEEMRGTVKASAAGQRAGGHSPHLLRPRAMKDCRSMELERDAKGETDGGERRRAVWTGDGRDGGRGGVADGDMGGWVGDSRVITG